MVIPQPLSCVVCSIFKGSPCRLIRRIIVHWLEGLLRQAHFKCQAWRRSGFSPYFEGLRRSGTLLLRNRSRDKLSPTHKQYRRNRTAKSHNSGRKGRVSWMHSFTPCLPEAHALRPWKPPVFLSPDRSVRKGYQATLREAERLKPLHVGTSPTQRDHVRH